MKTSYFGKSSNAVGAVSIARYPPKWYHFACYPKLAPSGDMIHINDMSEYSRLYQIRVLGRLDPERVYDELCELVAPYEPILLCFEKDKNECHRSIVADWLERHLDIEVRELGESPSSQMRLF